VNIPRAVADNLIKHLELDDLREGWPDGVYRTGTEEEAVWHVYLQPHFRHLSVGASRVIVISQITNEVLADEMVGE
jgi:hypothetical protein